RGRDRRGVGRDGRQWAAPGPRGPSVRPVLLVERALQGDVLRRLAGDAGEPQVGIVRALQVGPDDVVGDSELIGHDGDPLRGGARGRPTSQVGVWLRWWSVKAATVMIAAAEILPTWASRPAPGCHMHPPADRSGRQPQSSPTMSS